MITYRDGSYIVKTPYSPVFVDMLKRYIPASDRKWDNASKVWIVSTKYGADLVRLIGECYKEIVTLPETKVANTKVKGKLVEVRYLSLIKDRDDYSRSAYGFSNGDWNLVFDEAVLQDFFDQREDKTQPKQASTLYEVLLLKPNASADEVKGAYRRMAKLWHPDRNREPNASEMFIKIQSAYELISDPVKRMKYDAGLKMLGQSNQQAQPKAYSEFQSPLRCGKLVVSGEMRIGRLHVSKIYDWEDITDMYGKVLVTSWPRNAKSFIEEWV